MVRLAWLLLAGCVALTTGCEKPEPVSPAPTPVHETPAAATETATVTVEPVPVIDAVTETIAEVVEALPAPEPAPPPEPAAATPLSDAGITLLVNTEVGSEALYRRKFTRPVWPKGQSGVTVGIGADLGQMTVKEILYDWAKHPQVSELPQAAGVSGAKAKILTAQMQHVITEFPLALDVFLSNDVLQYYRIASRSFPGLEETGANAQGALVSLVFNRGGVIPKTCTPGNSRYEMCMIRDECVPMKLDAGPCIARWLRVMKRVWIGKDIERGMDRRREEEAKLAELPDV